MPDLLVSFGLTALATSPHARSAGYSDFPSMKTDKNVDRKVGRLPSLQIFAILCSDGGENAGFCCVLATIATKFSGFM